jgi:hypothetical protein
MKVTVLKRQTLSDIALEVYGDISGLPGIARANGIAMTADLEVGQVLQCPDVVYDAYLQNYVRKNGIKPATAYTDEGGEIRQRIFTEQFTLEFE